MKELLELANSATGLIGFLIGFFTTMVGVALWYAKSQVKAYAAERDFNHLKVSFQQLSANLTILMREGDNRNADYKLAFSEIKKQLEDIEEKINKLT